MPSLTSPTAVSTAEGQTAPLPITKLIVAVHGIGDQFKFATIQSVAIQIAKFCGTPMPFPLGEFHPKEGEVRALQFDVPPKLEALYGGMGFAEVFWADIHQEAQKTGNTIEETKSWAQTMVERMQGFDVSGQAPVDGVPAGGSVDYAKTSAVVGEMVETIRVVENLCLVAEKAGLPKFVLRNLLDDYFGAVQLVAEFEDYRGRICGRFSDLMRKMMAAHPHVREIHIVAHSEGTAVSFYSLLSALAVPGGADEQWVKLVRGFMTFGSPIDKHIVMWPQMWKQFHEAPEANGDTGIRTTGRVMLEKPIVWWNYYDNGDPVGFELDTARVWLIDHHWVAEDTAASKKRTDGTRVPAGLDQQKFFHFPEEQDVGFTRYPLPGAAHVQYWTDEGVFGHFIQNVIVPEALKESSKKWPIPTSYRWTKVVSWVIPYVLCFLLLSTGTYLIYDSLIPFLTDSGCGAPVAGSEGSTFLEMFLAVIGIAALLAGTTVASRIPRLVQRGWWYLLPVAVFAAGAAAYWFWVPAAVHVNLGNCFPHWDELEGQKGIMILLALLISILSARVSKVRPDWGMKPLIILVAAATLRVAYCLVEGKTHPLWPLVLSTAAFLYLWWLAAMLFDLVFVWHLYIRGNTTGTLLRKIRRCRRVAAGEIPAENTAQ